MLKLQWPVAWPIIFILVAISVQPVARCADAQSNLLLETNTPFPKGTPIFDCACLDRKIVKGWFPPKDGSSNIQINFKTGRDGQTVGVHLTRSSGIPECDKAALDSIQGKKFFYVPTGEAEIVFEFNFRNFEPKGSSIILPVGKQAPPVLFIKTEYGPMHRANCFSYTDLNNKGVIDMLDGDLVAAKKSLEEAHKLEPFYEPASHNLKYLQVLIKEGRH